MPGGLSARDIRAYLGRAVGVARWAFASPRGANLVGDLFATEADVRCVAVLHRQLVYRRGVVRGPPAYHVEPLSLLLNGLFDFGEAFFDLGAEFAQLV